MKPTRILSTVAITAACALGVVPAAASAASTDVSQATSENWSGYVVGGSSDSSASGKSFKTVSGSWVAPTAKCTTTTGTSYSAFWVGLGGAGQTEALEQAGTEANCSSNGQASYYAWYELVPSAPVKVALAVHPGDHISTHVTVGGTAVSVSVANETTGQTFSKNLAMSSPDTSSAEWIAEAPSACDGSVSQCTPLPLTDFGKVSFTSSSATTSDGHTGTISDPAWSADAVSLTPGAGTSGFQGTSFDSSASSSGAATPSALSSDGSSFSVAYSSSGTSSAASTGGDTGTGAGQGDGYGQGEGYGQGDGGSGYGYGGGGDGQSYGYGSGGDGQSYGYSGGYGDSTGGYGGYGSSAGGYSYGGGDGGYSVVIVS